MRDQDTGTNKENGPSEATGVDERTEDEGVGESRNDFRVKGCLPTELVLNVRV